ncbi:MULTISPECIES: rhomboid family intramembrane serine protease [Fervidobacterium]|uniref:Rhomboid family protein n=1 Tax=Fervidobacterium nodosum (strain ATCC 35602 / DSM 5306 / Rt17-B1) TaxID=381764 RepID=A7HMD0_FERNB|nr:MULTISPECIES: rhomboid family intramembrane serine protease [Fervidobacterium]ABS61063.1 Rhomboid family protein [Fervidobacterium nodosum Rt17-B1]KAF2962407.1 rhomboid family intramembrane serine protease [Fervidobacterium sp. 2310opik-2]PHJ12930.1 peptidase S54 [Fervidobacterium sp. SC_NGM5_G05]
MFPLYDTIPSIRKPFVNIMIIIVNVIVFAYELMISSMDWSGEVLEGFFRTFGFVPEKMFYAFPIVAMFTHMFVHGGWSHIIGNMWFLKIFGDNVEDAMGHFKFFIFYITGGLFALFFHVIFNPFSPYPLVGASGAISAVMGAYFVLFYYSRIVSLVFLILPFIVEIPAFIYLPYWFIIQVLNGLLADVTGTGVAYWAHAGGFIYGVIVGMRVRKKRYWY